MCGLIGFAAKYPAHHVGMRADFMTQGLYVNALRGQHSTGFFKVDGKTAKALYVKDAVDARLFLQQRNLVRHLEDVRSESVFVVGHNRHATLGGRGLDNAHPFAAGSVVLVHNGTLRSYHSLPTHPQGDSDSARVTQALSEAKPAEASKVLADLQGDYAFIWHDSRTKLLNVATNGNRPLSYLKTDSHVFFASEGMMVKMLLARIGGNDQKLPRIQHFKPFHVYRLKPGALDWTTEKYTETKRTAYVSHNAGQHHVANKSSQQADVTDYEDYYDHYGHMGGHAAGNPTGAGNVVPRATIAEAVAAASLKKREIAKQAAKKAGKLSPQVQRFVDESKRAAKKRITESNALLERCGLPFRIGDQIDVTNETTTFYDSGKAANEEEPLGSVTGYVEHFDPKFKDPILFETVVHQAVMADVWHEAIDTVKATLASATLDVKTKDLTCTAIYKEVGHFRRPVSPAYMKDRTVWPPYIEKILQGHRWFYEENDLPRFEWFTSTVMLTSREMDVILNGTKCVLCEKPVENIAYDNVVFVDEGEFCCKTCTKEARKTTVRKDVPTAALEEAEGRANNVLRLPTAQKPRVRVNHGGVVVVGSTGDAEVTPPKGKAGSKDS